MHGVYSTGKDWDKPKDLSSAADSELRNGRKGVLNWYVTAGLKHDVCCCAPSVSTANTRQTSTTDVMHCRVEDPRLCERQSHTLGGLAGGTRDRACSGSRGDS